MLAGLGQKIAVSLAFAALIYLGLTLYADAPKMAQALLDWNWQWLPLVIIAVLVNYLLRFVRWHYYLHVVGVSDVPALPSLLIFLSGFSLAMVPGKVGDLLKSVLLKARNGTPISYSASIVAAERLSDALGMILLVAVGSIVYPLGVPALVAIVAAVAVGVALMQSRPLAERLLATAERLPFVGRFAHLGRNLYESAYLLLRWRPLLISLALSATAWFGECVAFFLVLIGFGAAPSLTLLMQAMLIYGGASLFGAVTLLPGGVGPTEGSMTSLVQMLVGLSPAVASAATLLVRASTLWFAIILGGLALLFTGIPASADEATSAPPAA